jgi:hypothetical protein
MVSGEFDLDEIELAAMARGILAQAFATIQYPNRMVALTI